MQGTNDLQTKADRAAQQYIMETLSKSYPKATIIGEEGELSTLNEGVQEILQSEKIPVGLLSKDILEKNIPENLGAIKEEDVSYINVCNPLYLCTF